MQVASQANINTVSFYESIFFSANNYANDWSNDSKTTLKFIRSQLLFIFMPNVLWTNGHKRFFLLNWKVINDRNGISTKILFDCRSQINTNYLWLTTVHSNDCFLCYGSVYISISSDCTRFFRSRRIYFWKQFETTPTEFQTWRHFRELKRTTLVLSRQYIPDTITFTNLKTSDDSNILIMFVWKDNKKK